MFCGHQPFILAPKLCLRHKPLCHHCPLCSAGFRLASPVVGPYLAAPRALQPRAPAPSTSTASGPSSCSGFLWGPALPAAAPPRPGLRVAWPSVFCGGRPRPWAAQQRETGGRQGKHGPQRGARNSADSALLRPGRGSASPRGGGPKARAAPPPTPVPETPSRLWRLPSRERLRVGLLAAELSAPPAPIYTLPMRSPSSSPQSESAAISLCLSYLSA